MHKATLSKAKSVLESKGVEVHLIGQTLYVECKGMALELAQHEIKWQANKY